MKIRDFMRIIFILTAATVLALVVAMNSGCTYVKVDCYKDVIISNKVEAKGFGGLRWTKIN